MKKGIFFTIDALIGALLLLGGLTLLSSHYSYTPTGANLDYYADDLLNTMSLITVDDLRNDTFISSRIDSGEITNINNTLMEQVGEYWANGDFAGADAFVQNIIDFVVPQSYGFSVQFDNETVYARSNPTPTYITKATKMISGLEKAKPIKGFVANARATQIVKETSETFFILPQGSGWYGSGWLENRKAIMLPPNITITNATLFLALHTDNNNADSAFHINNQCFFDRGNFTLLFGTSEGNFGVTDATGCLNPGNNTLEITRFNNGGYNAHTHPGFRLEVRYEQNETVNYDFSSTTQVSERIYLDEIRTYRSSASTGQVNGVWATATFDLPPDSTDHNVFIQIRGENITDYTGGSNFWDWSDPAQSLERRDNDVIVFLNQLNPIFTDANPNASPIYRFDQAFLGPFTQSGTNALSIYFNTYGDSRWGTSTPKAIVSDPINDEGGSSFIEVNYTIPAVSDFGVIEITNIDAWGGNAELQKTASWSFPAGIVRAGDVYLNVAQRASWDIELWVENANPPGLSIYRSPGSRQVPPRVYVPPANYDTSSAVTNFILTMDYGSVNNWFLAESSTEYTFYMPSFVGYGEVFSTEQEAVDDALSRLNSTIGPYINVAEAEITNSSINDVPSMWGPATVNVVTWS